MTIDKKGGKVMLFSIADVLESNNVKFFLTDGVCLGAYREKNFIDWDSDIDLKINAEDFMPKYKQLLNEFTNAGFGIATHSGGLSFLNIMLLKLSPYRTQAQCTCMFLVGEKRRAPGVIRTTAYPAYLFEDPEQIDFLGRKFFIPTPVAEYLELTYGFDYMTPKESWSRPPNFLQSISADDRAKMEVWHEL